MGGGLIAEATAAWDILAEGRGLTSKTSSYLVSPPQGISDVYCCGYRVKPQHLASLRWHDWSVSTGGSRLLVTLNDGEGVRLLLAA